MSSPERCGGTVGEIVDPSVCPCCGTDATKLRVLADWVEASWRNRSEGTEVQDDLRQWADAIHGTGLADTEPSDE